MASSRQKQADGVVPEKTRRWSWQIVLTLIFGISQAGYYWYPRFEKKDGPAFVVKATSGKADFPPTFLENLRKSHDCVNSFRRTAEEVVRLAKSGGLSSDKERDLDMQEESLATYKATYDELWSQIEEIKYKNCSLKLSLRNDGTLDGHDVRIRIPTDGVAYVKWDTDKGESRAEFSKEILIGRLPIQKEVDVSIWAYTDSFTLIQPQLIHSNGTIPIIIPKMAQKDELNVFGSVLIGLALSYTGFSLGYSLAGNVRLRRVGNGVKDVT